MYKNEGGTLFNMGLIYANIKEPQKSSECFIAALALFKRLDLDHMVAKVRRMAESSGIKI